MFWLAGITLLAATINALGYGFSSITVPLALLFLSNRVLNPALVIIEVPLNAYVLWVNRAELPGVWRRVFPMIVGLVPGVVAGTLLVSRVSPDWLKLYTFIVLLPLILLQAAGVRKPIQAERSARLIFGSGIGVSGPISGPPLALNSTTELCEEGVRAALGGSWRISLTRRVLRRLFLKPVSRCSLDRSQRRDRVPIGAFIMMRAISVGCEFRRRWWVLACPR
jgi:hypothetical protein